MQNGGKHFITRQELYRLEVRCQEDVSGDDLHHSLQDKTSQSI